MAKKFKRENCDSTLRATVTDQLGRTVSLFGTHAFEWSIIIASDNSITMQTFKKGDIARKEFNKYKKKKIMDLKEYAQLLKHNKYTLYKHTGNNLVNVGDIYANTVEEAEHLALLNHIKYDIITVTEFLK